MKIPEELIHLKDCISECLPDSDARLWPDLFDASIEVGSNLSLIWPKFAIEILSNDEFGVLLFVKNDDFIVQNFAINQVLDIYLDWVKKGEKPTRGRWDAARDGVRNAVKDDVWRAKGVEGDVWAGIRYAMATAAKAAADTPETAAETTAIGGTYWEDDSRWWLWARDTIIELLKEASND